MVKHRGCMQQGFSWIAAIIETRTAQFIALDQRDTLAHSGCGGGRSTARAACADHNQVIFIFGHGFLRDILGLSRFCIVPRLSSHLRPVPTGMCGDSAQQQHDN